MTAKKTEINVPFWTDFFGALAERNPGLMYALERMETAFVLGDKPAAEHGAIYVSGLARSGSTILLELLAAHPETATHAYRDYPFITTPYWVNWFLDRAANREDIPTERSHQDRIKITSKSPEAMEEMIWMHFFPDCHDPSTNNVLDAGVSNPEFERVYRNHIRKLLMIKQGSVYLAKGNYNITRLQYIQRILPSARFIIPVRDPISHIASLMKQHELLKREETRDPKLLDYMRRVGHFEFGLGRKPINTGNSAVTQEIMKLWDEGQEIRGWARYWAQLHMHLAATLRRDITLAQASMVVHYEALCTDSLTVLGDIYSHCGLTVPNETLQAQARTLSLPQYYKIPFSDAEKGIILEETKDATAALGITTQTA